MCFSRSLKECLRPRRAEPMGKRWILYGVSLVGGIVFYFAYREWFSWLALMGILWLPVAALAVSLPAMTSLRLAIKAPEHTRIGARLPVKYTAKCPLPAPPYRCRLRVSRSITGENWLLEEGEPLPTTHCGHLVCQPAKPRTYDYLGLLGIKLRGCSNLDITVRPVAVAVDDLPSLARYAGRAWKPKPGGGFAENHEIRLYRPGDKMNQIHWKLSSKMNKLMVREAMEPVQDRVLVEMILRGTPEELDRKFGQMLWLSQFLLEKDIDHHIRVLTGSGVVMLPVTSAYELETALDLLLAETPAAADGKLEPLRAAWQYRIGGGEDEA